MNLTVFVSSICVHWQQLLLMTTDRTGSSQNRSISCLPENAGQVIMILPDDDGDDDEESEEVGAGDDGTFNIVYHCSPKVA